MIAGPNHGGRYPTQDADVMGWTKLIPFRTNTIANENPRIVVFLLL